MKFRVRKKFLCDICLEDVTVMIFETELDNGWGGINCDDLAICRICFVKEIDKANDK